MSVPPNSQLLDATMEKLFVKNRNKQAINKIRKNRKLRTKWDYYKVYIRDWAIDAHTRAGQLKKLGEMEHVSGLFKGEIRKGTKLTMTPQRYVKWAQEKGAEAFNMLHTAPLKRPLWKLTGKTQKRVDMLYNYENWVKASKKDDSIIPKHREGLTILGLELTQEIKLVGEILKDISLICKKQLTELESEIGECA